MRSILKHLYNLEAQWRGEMRPDVFPISHMVREALESMRDGASFSIEGKRAARVACWARMSERMLYTLVCICVFNDGDSAALLAVYVHESLRGRGLGSEAICEATAWLRRWRLRCTMPLLRCVRVLSESESYQRMLQNAGWSVSRLDGSRRCDGAHVQFEP